MYKAGGALLRLPAKQRFEPRNCRVDLWSLETYELAFDVVRIDSRTCCDHCRPVNEVHYFRIRDTARSAGRPQINGEPSIAIREWLLVVGFRDATA